jgi:hypothetical protein
MAQEGKQMLRRGALGGKMERQSRTAMDAEAWQRVTHLGFEVAK